MQNPTHYYCDAGHNLSTKNKLQADFSKYLNSLKGRLIDANKLDSLKKEILAKQDELNAIYSRCKSINISWYSPGNEAILISGFYCVSFSIRPAHYDSN